MTIDQAYAILGIYEKHADEETIKRAFYEAARLTHPDSNPSDENAVHKFKMIKEAYEYLCKHAPDNSSTFEKKNYKDVDKWDFYDEADRRYAEEKKKQAQRRAQETIRKRTRMERDRHMQQKMEEAKRMQEASKAMKENQTSAFREDGKIERRRYEQRKGKPRKKADSFGEALKMMGEDFCYKFCYPIVKLGWTIEFVCFSVTSIATIAFVINALLSGPGALTLCSKNIAMLFWWTMAISGAYRITKIIREYYGDKIILTLAFLILMEIGLAMYKILGDVFSAAGQNVCNIILISISAIYEAVIYRNILVSLKRKTDRSFVRFISIEMIWCFGVGILFSIISMVLARV